MNILERLFRSTPEGQSFHRYQQNFEAAIGIGPQILGTETRKRSNPMTFAINGVQFRLGFHHSHLKRQPPSRFGAAVGMTTCMIYRLGKDGEGKPKWHLLHVASVLQYGQYQFERGRKKALKAALDDIGWGRHIRTIVWAAYHQRKDAIPSVTMVTVSAQLAA